MPENSLFDQEFPDETEEETSLFDDEFPDEREAEDISFFDRAGNFLSDVGETITDTAGNLAGNFAAGNTGAINAIANPEATEEDKLINDEFENTTGFAGDVARGLGQITGVIGTTGAAGAATGAAAGTVVPGPGNLIGAGTGLAAGTLVGFYRLGQKTFFDTGNEVETALRDQGETDETVIAQKVEQAKSDIAPFVYGEMVVSSVLPGVGKGAFAIGKAGLKAAGREVTEQAGKGVLSKAGAILSRPSVQSAGSIIGEGTTEAAQGAAQRAAVTAAITDGAEFGDEFQKELLSNEGLRDFALGSVTSGTFQAGSLALGRATRSSEQPREGTTDLPAPPTPEEQASLAAETGAVDSATVGQQILNSPDTTEAQKQSATDIAVAAQKVEEGVVDVGQSRVKKKVVDQVGGHEAVASAIQEQSQGKVEVTQDENGDTVFSEPTADSTTTESSESDSTTTETAQETEEAVAETKETNQEEAQESTQVAEETEQAEPEPESKSETTEESVEPSTEETAVEEISTDETTEAAQSEAVELTEQELATEIDQDLVDEIKKTDSKFDLKGANKTVADIIRDPEADQGVKDRLAQSLATRRTDNKSVASLQADAFIESKGGVDSIVETLDPKFSDQQFKKGFEGRNAPIFDGIPNQVVSNVLSKARKELASQRSEAQSELRAATKASEKSRLKKKIKRIRESEARVAKANQVRSTQAATELEAQKEFKSDSERALSRLLSQFANREQLSSDTDSSSTESSNSVEKADRSKLNEAELELQRTEEEIERTEIEEEALESDIEATQQEVDDVESGKVEKQIEAKKAQIDELKQDENIRQAQRNQQEDLNELKLSGKDFRKNSNVDDTSQAKNTTEKNRTKISKAVSAAKKIFSKFCDL